MASDRQPERETERIEYTTPPSGSGGRRALGLQVLVSGLICAGLLFTGWLPSAYVTDSVLTARIQAVAASVDSVRASATDALNKSNTATQDVKALKDGMGSYQSSLASVQKSVSDIKPPDVSGLNSQIATLSSKVDTLTKQLSDSQTTIATLQTQVKALNTTNGGTVTTTGKVVAELVTNNNIPFGFTTQNSTTTTTYSIPLKVRITNGLNKEVQNLQLYVQILGYATSGVYPSGTASLAASSGGVWHTFSSSGSSYYFTNSNTSTWAGSGLTVAANTTKTITLIFTYSVQPNQAVSTLQFTPDLAPVSTGDYDVIN